jgi:hypothetical protein
MKRGKGGRGKGTHLYMQCRKRDYNEVLYEGLVELG